MSRATPAEPKPPLAPKREAESPRDEKLPWLEPNALELPNEPRDPPRDKEAGAPKVEPAPNGAAVAPNPPEPKPELSPAELPRLRELPKPLDEPKALLAARDV